MLTSFCTPLRLHTLDSHLRVEYIDYDSIYGSGGNLCYRVQLCEQMLAIQDTCGTACCQAGESSDRAFASVRHNYLSDNGPGPWVVATLTDFAFAYARLEPTARHVLARCGVAFADMLELKRLLSV